jgi:hypothetical protein
MDVDAHKSFWPFFAVAYETGEILVRRMRAELPCRRCHPCASCVPC